MNLSTRSTHLWLTTLPATSTKVQVHPRGISAGEGGRRRCVSARRGHASNVCAHLSRHPQSTAPYLPKVMNLSTRSTRLWLTTLPATSIKVQVSGTPIFTNHIRHREVTGRRYTGLLVTFSRPIESTCAPCTGPEEERGRPVLQATVGRLRLGLAHHPRPVGAGAGSALSRPSWAAFLALQCICNVKGRLRVDIVELLRMRHRIWAA